MQHASSAQLVDAVRGALAPQERAALDRHLQECADCADALRFWQRFADGITADAGFEPPAAAVRAVKAYFAGSRASQPRPVDRATSGVRALVATLTFDTLQQPLPVAVRACATGTRQLLYDASPLMVDLRLEISGRSQRILLAGQIANADDPGSGGQDARVSVVGRAEELFAVRANQYGEFHCEFNRRPDLVLSIALKDGRQIVLPLDRLPISPSEDDFRQDS
ncbi:MAG: zf-HC2 domain-containing protein [Acidobacteria bacterium]|nr:zf-HC2 domain-containing protein [Acidobacteriota bacterium]